MTINIDIDKLFEYGLTPNEYITLFLVKNNKLNEINFNVEKPIQNLKSKGLIDSNGEITKKIPKELFGENKIEDLEPYWLQLKNTYPKKDGPRRLHDSPSTCEKKYIRIIKKNPNIHKQVMEGLQEEIKLRTQSEMRGEFFPAPKLMSTYINNKSWEGYLNNDDKEEIIDKDLI